MRAIISIARRELQAYFNTAVGWLCLLGFVSLTGLTFVWILWAYSDPMNAMNGQPVDINQYLVPEFFGTMAVFLLFLAPALSMRLLSEDLQCRSFELLLSSPISSTEIVLGKYLGALGYLAVMLLCTTHCAVILYWLSEPDTAVLLLNYLSTFLMAAAFMSMGLLFSAFTKSQLIALALGFGAALANWFMWGIGELVGGKAGETMAFISILSHTENLNKGLLHSQDLIYFLCFSCFFLFATHQRIEAYRWQ